MSSETLLLEAAARGDVGTFRRVAETVGGLQVAQEIVRTSDVIRLGGTCELIDRGVVPPTQAGRRTPRSIRTSAGQRWRCAVAFTSSAAQELRDEVAEFDGYEIGGGLFGSVADDGTVIVERVSGPSYWMERSTNEIVIEPDRYRAIEETLPWVGAGVGTGTSTIPCRRSRAMLTSAAGRPSFGVRSASMRG